MVRTLILLALGLVACVPTANQAPALPNVIIILADDLGYGDLGCYNAQSLIPTSNLDQLATEGIRFTNAYCPVSVCSPTRYALMTGTYPWRSWKKTGVMRNYERSMIRPEQLTLPELLKDAGYHTSGFGKWHLGTVFPTTSGAPPGGFEKFYATDNGANIDFTKMVSDGPLDHGFDQWLGFSCASECWIVENRNIVGWLDHQLYTTEAAAKPEHLFNMSLQAYLGFITDKSIEYLIDRSKNGKPFFLYYAPYVPHIPLSVEEDYVGSTGAGLYGDYVYQLDQYIGRLLNTLDSLDLKEQTIVLFASDNGSQFQYTSPQMDLENAGNNPGDSLDIASKESAHRPNGALRGTKWTEWEGGVRTPLIARWPGHFPQNRSSDELIALNDIISTMAAITGQQDQDIGMDGYNALGILTGKSESQRKQVIVQSSGHGVGIRKENWKFVCEVDFDQQVFDYNNQALFDLSKDPGETTNLAVNFPDRVEELKAELDSIMFSVQGITAE